MKMKSINLVAASQRSKQQQSQNQQQIPVAFLCHASRV